VVTCSPSEALLVSKYLTSGLSVTAGMFNVTSSWTYNTHSAVGCSHSNVEIRSHFFLKGAQLLGS